jgi:hypothetical protein
MEAEERRFRQWRQRRQRRRLDAQATTFGQWNLDSKVQCVERHRKLGIPPAKGLIDVEAMDRQEGLWRQERSFPTIERKRTERAIEKPLTPRPPQYMILL